MVAGIACARADSMGGKHLKSEGWLVTDSVDSLRNLKQALSVPARPLDWAHRISIEKLDSWETLTRNCPEDLIAVSPDARLAGLSCSSSSSETVGSLLSSASFAPQSELGPSTKASVLIRALESSFSSSRQNLNSNNYLRGWVKFRGRRE